MTAPYLLKQADRSVVPGSGGRHRAVANRSKPPAHASSHTDGVEIGLQPRWPSWLSWRALIGRRA